MYHIHQSINKLSQLNQNNQNKYSFYHKPQYWLLVWKNNWNNSWFRICLGIILGFIIFFILAGCGPYVEDERVENTAEAVFADFNKPIKYCSPWQTKMTCDTCNYHHFEGLCTVTVFEYLDMMQTKKWSCTEGYVRIEDYLACQKNNDNCSLCQ